MRYAVMVSKAPFVLTGVEQRGTSGLAAVAPQGFSGFVAGAVNRGRGVGRRLDPGPVPATGRRRFRVNGRLADRQRPIRRA